MTSTGNHFELGRRAWALSLVGTIAVFGWATWTSARIATSRLLTKYGTVVADAEMLDLAAALTPRDAEARYTRASMLNYFGRSEAALPEFEIAASLRPRHYLLWQDLGLARDQLGDPGGALIAFNEAVRLAPAYSHPRWLRGNLLFRMARYDEAFADLRYAVFREPDRLLGFIDLCWGASQHNATITEQLVQAQDAETHRALAQFFARQGAPEAAVAHYNAAGVMSDQNRRDLITELIRAGSMRQAFALWQASKVGHQAQPQTVYDGSFEDNLNVEEAGFGWRPVRGEPGVGLSLDQERPHTGARSLKVNYQGSTNPSAQIISQLVIVEPGATYRLSVAARGKDIVTGGPPVIAITDAKGDRRELGRMVPLDQSTGAWKVLTLEFTTGGATDAVWITLRRENCTTAPCPIFGVLNLDSFALERLK